MSVIETNIFAIENLDALKTEYVLYRIRGLTRGDNEYFQNKDEITRKLSYDLQRPALVIEKNGYPHLVLPADAPHPPQPFSLVRAQVYFDKLKDPLPRRSGCVSVLDRARVQAPRHHPDVARAVCTFRTAV